MARRSPVKLGLALALFCVISFGRADDKCRSGCRGAAHTFKYHEGTTYKYNFDSKVQVSLSSAEGQQSVTEIKATVLLTQQPQCNQILRLQNVQVIGSNGKKYNQIPDIDKPIKINFHDGHLEDSICITPGDTQNSLNLKRAIASIFQANLKSGHETDVFGVCPTDVSQHKEGNLLVVQKTRNLNRCAFRENIKQDFLTTAFNLNSEIKSSPILDGDYNAKLKIKSGILDEAVITERYLYVPFSVGDKGAKTLIETTLKYVGTAKDNSPIKVSEPRSIIFEDPHPVTSPHANVNSVLAAVKQVAKTIDLTVGEDTAKAFTNLVRILRVSKKDDLLAVYNQVRAGVGFPDKIAGKKIFLDALLRAGNGDNIEVAIELLRNKELSTIEQNLVYLGLSTVRHATENSLNSAVNLLNQPNLPRSAYLGIGNLAGKFCRQHSCENVEAVKKLTQKFVQKLGKASNRQEENEIIYVLKALGNFRHLDDNVLPKIIGYAQDKHAPSRVRIAALETYLADPCKDKLRDSALSILKDIQQDSEVRIKAYLALAQCPNNKVGNAVKTLLDTEPSYQVGGFIVTHIHNLRSSANPDKELAKQYLGLTNIPKRFPFDPRKYSANGEFSYTVDTLGLANSLETNVIYSQNSFLPRSTSLNLTAEIFGHNFNFLEIEARQENLDRLIEHYFGPRGLLRSNSLHELWNNKGKHASEVIKNLKDRLQKTLRNRRDISKSDIDYINKQLQTKTNELNKDLDLDLSVKTFGSELVFLNLNEDVAKYTPEAIIDKIVDGINGGFDKLKHFDETLRTNFLFLDAEFAYPTSSGFPLRLGVEGSSNVQVKATGAIDIRSLLNEENTAKLSLIPSANIQVAGRLTIDTLVLESGLKVASTLHTATGGDLVLDLKKNSVDVKFSIPVEKQNIISGTHDIVFHTREWGAEEANAPLKFTQNKDFSICLDQLSPFIGLTFCGEFTGPNVQGEKVPILPFPLSGDAKVGVFIEREDLSHYHYHEVFHNNHEKIGAEFVLEAIGKNGAKKVSLNVDAFLLPEILLRASLSSPVTSALIEGRVINTQNEKSLSVKFLQDKNEYLGKLGVGIEGSSDKQVYKPLLQYKTPQHQSLQVPPYRVEGQVIVETKSAANSIYTFDNVKIIIPDQKTISINGKFGTEPETIFADVGVSDGSNNVAFKGKLRYNPNLVKYNAELKNSVNPQSNIRVKGDLERTGEGFKHFFQVTHGGDFSDKKNVLTIENSLKYRNKGPQDFLVDTKNKITYPLFDTSLKFDFELKPKAVEYSFDIQYTNVKIGSELEWEHNSKHEGTDFKLDFGLWGLNNRVDLKSKRQVTGDQSQIENLLEVNGKRAEVNGKIKHHVKPQDIDVAADLIVKLPTHNTPFNVLSGFKLNANELDASHKVTSGGTVYVDIFLKANRAGNANGSIKVNLKGQLVINGHVKVNKGSGSGEIIIELPAVGRTSKLDSTFTIHEPTYNVIVNIYPNKDQGKKITLSSQTTANLHEVKSKNFVDVFGEKLEVNVKGNQQGEINNGKINGELDVTFPNEHYLSAKLNREIKNVHQVLNGDIVASLEHRVNKNQPGNKITFKGQIKDTKPIERIFDVSYQLLAETASGRSLNIDLKAQKQPAGEFFFWNKIHGSVLSHPIETSVKGNCHDTIGNYEATSSYPPLGKLTVSGKHDVTGGTKPLSGDIKIEIQSKSDVLRNVKIAARGSVLKLDGIALEGDVSVFADAAEGVLIDVTTKGEVKSTVKESRVKGSFKCHKGRNFAVDLGIKQNDNKKVLGDLALEYGTNQKIKGSFDLERLSPNEYKLEANLDTPLEKFKNNNIKVHTKRNPDGSHYQNEVSLTNDGKTWSGTTDLVLSEVTPSIDIKITCPSGKIEHLLVKVTKFTDRQLAGQLKIVNQEANFLLESTVDANFESVDDFHIKATANSPNFKIDKYVIEAHNKPAKTGRRIQITAKSGNKNILAGSTSYTAREEHGKLIVEGSGSFKLHDQTQSANFKYIRQNLSQKVNGETGIEISFDAGLGNKAIDAEFKATNKQFRILNSYCEEKKQCAHVEVDVKTTIDDVSYFNQEVEIAVDLRKLGLSHEFGLKAVTTRKGYVLDHTVDIHFQSQANSKYQYSLYLHPRETGVSLTTPKRIVALEANVNWPAGILTEGGKITGECVFYLDKKNQPGKKSGLIAFLDLNSKSQSLVGEARFTHPVLKKPLVVEVRSKIASTSYDFVFIADVFSTPDQKLVISFKQHWSDPKSVTRFEYTDTTEIKGTPLGLNIIYDDWLSYNIDDYHYKVGSKIIYTGHKKKYQSIASYESTPRNADLALELLNLPIFKLHSKIQLSDKQQIVDSEFSCYGHKPLISHLEIKNYNTFKYTLAKKDKPNDKFQINSGLIPGEIADFRAEVIKNGAPHELCHGTVKLDDANFLKSDYNVQSKNIEDLLLKPIKNGIQEEGKELQQLSDKIAKEIQEELGYLSERAKQTIPSVKPLQEYYIGELTKIKEEILADKTIKDASEFLYNVISAISQAFGETFANFSKLVEDIAHIIEKSFGKIIEVIQKELVPKVKEISDKLLHLAQEVFNSSADIVLTIWAKLAEIAEKYRPELQQLATVCGEVTQDFLKAVVNVYEAVRNVIIDQWQQIYNEIKSLPVVEQLKAEYQRFVKHGLPNTDAIANGIKELLSTVKDLAPTAELKELIEAVSDYVTKKITKQAINDKAAIDRIIKAISAAIKQLIGAVFENPVQPDLQSVKVPLPAQIFNKLPRLAAVKFSPISYLLGEEIVIPTKFLLSLINKPRNWFAPFPLYGTIAQGQHIFTFDGQHLTFPGKCNYVLAHDTVDGNFSIIGSYNNGLLAAISLVQGPDTITLKSNGAVLVNSAPSELPARKPHVAAFRDLGKYNLVSDYGVHIICAEELFVCTVSTSGFYHGKLKGLLGNGNNEPYDDFILPNGKIVTSESEFGNSYKTNTGCAAVQAVSNHEHHDAPTCNKLFGWESSLRLCYPFVPINNYKLACQHGVAAGVKDTERAIAFSYVAACLQHNIPVRVPAEFVQCKNGDKPTSVGDQFSVKTPGKSADIVVLVDTSKENEATYKEYVQPLIQQLTSELNNKGVGDINFHIVAYGGENQWPSHITTNGGKLTFKGKAPNLHFSENPKDEKVITGCPQVDGIIEVIKGICDDLKLAFGLNLQALTYNEGLEYRFRAQAIKSIIAVTSSPCEIGRFYPLQILRTLLYRDKTINLNLITPISRSGAKAEAKNIVGFNSQNVFALGQTKNKIKHFSDLDKELTYYDYCIDFTVQNGGNVFVSDHIHLQPKATRKQFIQLTSHGIVEQLVGAENGYDCECKYVNNYAAANVCKLVSSKEKAQAKKAGTKS